MILTKVNVKETVKFNTPMAKPLKEQPPQRMLIEQLKGVDVADDYVKSYVQSRAFFSTQAPSPTKLTPRFCTLA